MPEPLGVPPFAPVRVRRGAHRLRRAVRRRHRALAAGLALTAATALAASGAREPGGRSTGDDPRRSGGPDVPERAGPARGGQRPPAELIAAGVHVADARTVRLLRPDDRVDVIATPGFRAGEPDPPDARVVARSLRVAEVRRVSETSGALVVLSVPRAVAGALAAAGATSAMAVTLC
ncbi:hypothetical protein [Streptomyces sp. CAU 1734]|uniref:hypothetical protein n=1 Tax=Streptomyces sp. CAU 1734 TaxID=3140360 RepID=UPI003260781D